MTSSELPGVLDHQRPIRQRPLQRLRLAPGRAHPDVALLLGGQDHRHRLFVDPSHLGSAGSALEGARGAASRDSGGSEGEVLDALVQKRHNKSAALKLLPKLL